MSGVATSGQQTYMRLRVAQHLLAIAAKQVEELVEYRTPVPLPTAPAHLLGLMQLRDRSVPLVALDVFMENAIACERRQVVIVHADGMRVGIVCDEVTELREIAPEALTPIPHLEVDGRHPYLSPPQDSAEGPVRVLDVSAFLAAARVRKQ